MGTIYEALTPNWWCWPSAPSHYASKYLEWKSWNHRSNITRWKLHVPQLEIILLGSYLPFETFFSPSFSEVLLTRLKCYAPQEAIFTFFPCFSYETENLHCEAYQGFPLMVNKTLSPPKVDCVIYTTECKPKVSYCMLNPLKKRTGSIMKQLERLLKECYLFTNGNLAQAPSHYYFKQQGPED